MSSLDPRRDGFNKDKTEERKKHVGFTAEDPNRHQKLRRKDTPHYNKNTRINFLNAKQDGKKVAAIIAQTSKMTNSDEGETRVLTCDTRESTVTEGANTFSQLETVEKRPKMHANRKSARTGRYGSSMMPIVDVDDDDDLQNVASST